MSYIKKTYGRMILLEWFLVYNNKLPIAQYGSRSVRTTESERQLVISIQRTFTKNDYLACLFIDVKIAF